LLNRGIDALKEVEGRQLSLLSTGKKEYLAKKPLTTAIPKKRTLLEAFLHQDPVSQLEDEFKQRASAPAVIVSTQSSNLFRWHVDN
jgi:hypothetical protein